MTDYHSATVTFDIVSAPALDRWEESRGVSLAWDLARHGQLPAEFKAADVLYAEPPFRRGWEVFHERRGVEPAMPYPNFMYLCSTLVKDRGGVLICDPVAERYTEPPAYSQQVELFNPKWTPLALWYGMIPEREPSCVADLIAGLATRFDCVGDFCCGYGNTGRIFAAAGKRYVLSDADPHCVGYISEHAKEW